MSFYNVATVILAINIIALPFSGKDDRRAICVICTVLSVGLAILNELEKLTGAI